MSSVYMSNPAYAATKCIDGGYTDSTMCHSMDPSNDPNPPWLMLDQGSPASIKAVRIWNRQGGSHDRLGDHVLETSNDGTNFATCGTYRYPSDAGPHTETCVATARYLRIRLTNDPVSELHLREVEIFGMDFECHAKKWPRGVCAPSPSIQQAPSLQCTP